MGTNHMTNAQFTRRFGELADSFTDLRHVPNPSFRGRPSSGFYVPVADWVRWATNAQHLIGAVFGEQSPHYINFIDAFRRCHAQNGQEEHVRALQGVFLAAKDDFDGGYVFDVDLRVSGEVFGDFVVLARTALSEGHKDVAAVLACAALEDALKRYARAKGIATDDKGMQEVINALKSNGLVQGAQKTMLDTMPRIRNAALHADWGKLSEPEVSSVIGFVEQFLLTKFSP